MSTTRLVTRFADDMARELVENDYKTGWASLTVRQCLQRAEQELGELRRAIERGASFQEIRSEAADVGNFLAMLVWNACEAEREVQAGPTIAQIAAVLRIADQQRGHYPADYDAAALWLSSRLDPA